MLRVASPVAFPQGLAPLELGAIFWRGLRALRPRRASPLSGVLSSSSFAGAFLYIRKMCPAKRTNTLQTPHSDVSHSAPEHSNSHLNR